jgi:hypothetical protein
MEEAALGKGAACRARGLPLALSSAVRVVGACKLTSLRYPSSVTKECRPVNQLAIPDADRLAVEFVGRVRTETAGDDRIEVRGLDVAEEMGLTAAAGLELIRDAEQREWMVISAERGRWVRITAKGLAPNDR